MQDVTYILGSNATGKSNLLDVFRFLRDISKYQGGGLQKAIADRGGIKKLRCLHARKDNEVLIDVTLSENSDGSDVQWRYVIGFKSERFGAKRTIVTREEVWKLNSDRPILKRPQNDDTKDVFRLTQTHLEQPQANSKFREIGHFFSEINYLHLVPQLLKFGDRIGGHLLDNDPFGQGFLERVSKASPKVRDSRLKKIEKALSFAMPQFKELQFIQDNITGRPHLQARYSHYRPNAGWQREDQFSDGTLRLIGLLWSLLEGNSLLLLEEPELSLNAGIIEQIPAIINKVQRDRKLKRQIVITTHSEALLKDISIDIDGVVYLEPKPGGTYARAADENERNSIEAGLSIADVILPKTKSKNASQLSLFQ